MTETHFRLKNMLTKSCVNLVKLYFQQAESIKVLQVKVGEVKLQYEKEKVSEQDIYQHFEQMGFMVIRDAEVDIVEQIKRAAIELIYYSYNANSLIRNSDYISNRLQKPYDKLSKIFSQVTGITLEKYIILLKIEKVKELIHDDDYTLSEIAYMLGYSSVQYLSTQFKKVTSLTISEFRENPQAHRKALDTLIA